MKGLAFLGERRLAYLNVEDPTPGPGEVVLAIKASGMCGSDLYPYRAAHDPSISDHERHIGGHEPAGVVAAVGPDVPAHVTRAGDRVMVHHYHGCSMCEHCRSGWPQLCRPSTRTTYSLNAHGAHAPYMKVAATTLLPLHEGLSFAEGAAIGCGTGTAWGALERLQPHGTETLAVFGQGPVGLSATLLAAARGLRVIAIDLDNDRLDMAKRLGATETINSRATDPAQALMELTRGKGVDMVIEASGAPAAAQAGLAALAVWGKLCMVGIGGALNLEMRNMLDRQVTVLTSYTMSSVAQRACADFIVERGLDVGRLFTHHWTLEQADEAYKMFDAQASGKGVFLF